MSEDPKRPIPCGTLGAMGPEVSCVGLGLAALGRPGYINLGHGVDLAGEASVDALERRCHAMLDAAYVRGIRYVDAARSYGRAEAFLASWLQARQLPPGEIVVGSKWGYAYTAGWRVQAEQHEVKEHSIERFETQLAETQSLLGPYLALYQVHSVTLDGPALQNRALLDRLADLRDKGTLVGLTLSGSAQAETLRRACEIVRGKRRVFDVVQATWNLLEPSCGEALVEAHAEGMGVIVKEALANGRLTERGSGPEIAPLAREAKRRNVGLDALALAAVLAQPFCDVALSGAATVEQLDSNLEALGVDPGSLDLPRLLRGAESPEIYWKKRSQLSWN